MEVIVTQEKMLSKWLIVVFTVLQTVHAAPSPNVLGSDLSILVNNDLAGPEGSSANSAVILVTARSQESAASLCAELGESLWAPESNVSSIQATLDYLTFHGKYPSDQLYWVASSDTAARAIDRQGYISDTTTFSPESLLPALCTQSAPFANLTSQDTSAKWQVTVHSNNEYITGFRDWLSFRFLGVRFAPQPQRFTHSPPYKGTEQNVSATSYGSQCIQPSGGSEDCLFLNIWSPFLPASSDAPSVDLKPVMLWVHGGAFQSGTANDPTFDGGNLASRGDVVMVACNYRLGSFGFLALDDGITNGNYGLGDAINALDWVRANIQNFGGDSERITIFGQSAGAAAVRAMLTSPEANGKFKAAIPMSNLGAGGYGTTYSSWITIDQEVATTAKPILETTNCTTAYSQVECLRAIPAATLSSLGNSARYLVVDGTYLTTDKLPLDSSAQGSLSDVHLLQGLMRDDGGAITTYIQTTNISTAMIATDFNTSVVVNSGLFPIPTSSNDTLNVFNVTSRVATDTIFRCFDQASAYAGLLNNVFAPTQYFYEFNRSYQPPGYNPNAPVCQPPVTESHPNGDPSQEYFKCHSGEILYVFGTLAYNGYPLRDGDDLLFSQFVLDSWASFARTYNPNPEREFLEARGFVNTLRELDGAGSWEPFKNEGLGVRRLEWPSQQVGLTDVEQCRALGWPLELFV
ncbi:hypothetical protein HYALB_00013835 [Hymenoscyphus albidus]|uniref:Carboxylic ester hydrolase n=1 Tax=Hymenoscyphus albidus TaxID=595503 RepID=A0A9N9M0V6_9HELO|nr:hypothetical protein HYALB_00013835 [Hymenoscyphus albidus]